MQTVTRKDCVEAATPSISRKTRFRLLAQKGLSRQYGFTVDSICGRGWRENPERILDDAVVQYTEYDLATEKGHGTHYMRAWGGLMHCGNSRCRRGGYEVDRIVSEMLRENVTEKEFELRCPGDEGTPKGRKRGQRCYRSIKGKVTLKYKTTQDSDVAS